MLRRQIPKQECIPVGCVPSATVAVCQGVPGMGGAWSASGEVCLVQGERGVSAPRGWWYPSMN